MGVNWYLTAILIYIFYCFFNLGIFSVYWLFKFAIKKIYWLYPCLFFYLVIYNFRYSIDNEMVLLIV